MADLTNLKKFAIEKSKEYPELKEDIYDLVYLAEDEIEQGGSITHECELAHNSIVELIQNKENGK